MRLFLALIPFLPNYLNAADSFEGLEKHKARQKVFHQGFSVGESYKAFDSLGISYDLNKIVVSVSAFTVSEGKYTFLLIRKQLLSDP